MARYRIADRIALRFGLNRQTLLNENAIIQRIQCDLRRTRQFGHCRIDLSNHAIAMRQKIGHEICGESGTAQPGSIRRRKLDQRNVDRSRRLQPVGNPAVMGGHKVNCTGCPGFTEGGIVEKSGEPMSSSVTTDIKTVQARGER